MNIVQITPGAGGMYCGNCVRDNALVREMRRLGHEVTMVPLYLPLTLDEADQTTGTPIFFSGINVYLEQKSGLFRHAPEWLHRLLASPRLLRWAAGRAAKTKAEEVGDLTISMLRGESGHQARELSDLIGWLRTQLKPDVIVISNALLAGLARRLRQDLGAAVVCTLQGEDAFLDSLSPACRTEAWKLLGERAQEVDRFIAPSRYFATRMGERMGVEDSRISVVPNGINLEGFVPAATCPNPPVLGYFARMSRDKGLDTLVEAFILLRQRNRVPGLRLRVGGSCTVADEPFVESLKARLRSEGLLAAVEFKPNVDRAGKQAFLQTLSVFSVPALYGEAFGLYILEALACGVPVVQPAVAGFPELVEQTQGGITYSAGPATALAEALETLLGDPEQARRLGTQGRAAVQASFSIERMTESILNVYREVTAGVSV